MTVPASLDALEAAAAALEAAQGPVHVVDVLADSFPEQRAFILDPARRKWALCTRRAGKSYGAGLAVVKAALECPGTNHLILGKTRASVKNSFWKDVIKSINRKFRLGMRPNETELTMTLPNGSVIRLSGADANEKDREKLFGAKYRTIVIDEAEAFQTSLEELVYTVLGPSTADVQGTILLVGMPSNKVHGLFFELTTGKSKFGNDWSGHRWTAYANTGIEESTGLRVCDSWHADIEKMRATIPFVDEAPFFRQAYLGEWVVDLSKLVYRYTAERNSYTELPRYDRGRWSYVLGIDLGYNDPTAWVVAAYHDYDPNLYLLEAHKEEKLDVTAVAERTQAYRARFSFDRIVIDNANKQAVEEMKRRHNLPLNAADKTGKVDFIQLMNGDLISGRIKLNAATTEDLVEEYEGLIWNPRSEKLEEHAGCPNHLCFVAGTQVETILGPKPIEAIRVGDLVLTRVGFRPVTQAASTGFRETVSVRFSDGRSLKGTPEHPVWTENRGWVGLGDLTVSDVTFTSNICNQTNAVAPSVLGRLVIEADSAPHTTSRIKPESLSGRSVPTCGEHPRKSAMPVSFGGAGPTLNAPPIGNTSSALANGFTDRYGPTVTGQFLTASTSTTSMETPRTTPRPTSNVCWDPITTDTTSEQPAQKSPASEWQGSKRHELPPHTGTDPMLAESGTGNMLERLLPIAPSFTADAKSVAENSPRSAQPAPFAVVDVTPAGFAVVYALSVQEQPEYFANGVLVSNCDAALYAWRYCYSYLSERPQLPPPPGSPEFLRQQEDRMLESRLRQLKEAREDEADFWGSLE